MPGQLELSQTLVAAGAGDRGAMDTLLPLVYDELRRLAESHLRREREDHTLQATALVHEAYMKMIDQTRVQWRDRAHFFALASQAIRRILVDHARGRNRKKRVGDRARMSLDEAAAALADPHQDLPALDEALDRLGRLHPEKARIVEMRFFGGLSTEECAAVLGVTTRTAERYWQYARAWLYRELTGQTDGGTAPH